MPNILSLSTKLWDLTVWTRDNEKPRKVLTAVLKERGEKFPDATLFFSSLQSGSFSTEKNKDTFEDAKSIALASPLCYENRDYEFEIIFKEGATSCEEKPICHFSQFVERSFRSPNESTTRGTLNFGNSVGRFTLTFQYIVEDRIQKESLYFVVFPTKMDMEHDLANIQEEIDLVYPLWRFSFLQKTDHALNRTKKPHEEFELLWIAQFTSLAKQLTKAVKLVTNAPHSRLIKVDKRVKADRLKGKLSGKLEERIQEDFKGQAFNKKYAVEKSILSFDTPENRFVKMVLDYSIHRLSRFKTIVKQKYTFGRKNSEEILSKTFYSTMNTLTKPFEQLKRAPLFKEIGEFEGLMKESLVLHQRAGYSKVYRIWQELKLYLDFMGDDTSISLRSVEELYEIWCFIEVRKILITTLGFEDCSPLKKLTTKGVEKEFGSSVGKFSFKRGDGVTALLSHEPEFKYSEKKSRKREKIYSWTTTQRPDILLEVTLRDGGKFMWIFDAKYRIETSENIHRWPLKGTSFDIIPADAINQMHRYRDALLFLSEAEEDKSLEKSRPIVGAFALYPGYFTQKDDVNPYQESIDEIGIGGFPLLPGQENWWLTQFLEKQIGKCNLGTTYPTTNSDTLYLNESLRTTTYGLNTRRHSNLVMLASVPVYKDSEYVDRFSDGTAKWYHIPVKPKDGLAIGKDLMREIEYCAVTVMNGDSISCNYLYPIVKAVIKPRGEINEFAGGTSERTDEYWLLELGEPQELKSSIKRETNACHFDLRLVTKKDFLAASSWEDIETKYPDFFQTNPRNLVSIVEV